MTRRRSMHALLGTLALIAGCSTTHRIELNGVVRDRATGRAIPGARVVGADGTLTRTDAHGRFTLYVRPGSSADVRVSADGHASERVELDGAEASVELAATGLADDSFVIPSRMSTEAHVLSWADEGWLVLDGGVLDGASDADSEPPSHVLFWAGDPGDGALGAGAACVGCHQDPLLGDIVGAAGPHGGLADSCLACHAAPAADASVSCARCHGGSGPALASELRARVDRASTALDRSITDVAVARGLATSCGGVAAHFTQVGGGFVLVDAQGTILGDCDGDRLFDDDELWVAADQLGPELGAAIRELATLERDGSGGAHAPDRARELLHSLAR